MKLAGRKSALNSPVVYSTDRSKAVVLVLYLLFVALWFPRCFQFFYMCCDAGIVVNVFGGCQICFLFY